MEIENSRAEKYHDPDSRYDADLGISDKDQFNSTPEDDLKAKLTDWWYEAREAHADNRAEMAIDEDFIDGIQWSEEDAQLLRQRNQEPLVFNEMKPAKEWITGTEKRTKIDWKVLPRKDGEDEDAQTKTKLLKYISDVNKASFERSEAFDDAIGAGVGWLEVGVKSDPDDEPIFMRRETWRNIWLDPLSVKNDISDARYIVRSKVVDLDVAIQMWPEHTEALKYAADTMERIAANSDDDFYDAQLYYSMNQHGTMSLGATQDYSHGRRRVVRLIETWYREPTRLKVCRCSDMSLNGREYDPKDPEVVGAVMAGYASTYDAVRMKIRVAVNIPGGEVLQDMASPYNHNRFPFVPIWAYRYKRDNMAYGIGRNSRDPQRDLNKRRSKALFLLSVNRTIMDKGAVDDLDQYEDEVSRPDAIIEKNVGKNLEIETNVQLAEEHIMLAREDANYVRQGSGVTGENMGMETNATSGKAIRARQDQGTVVTATLFDNLRLSAQITGEIMLSLVEQFYTEEKIIRVTGERGANEFVHINQWDEESGQYLNDITRTQADFIVSESAHRESVRMAMFDQMMDMMSKLDSQTAMQMLDMVFELSDLPGKDELVKRIRKINGQVDPDDPEAERLADEEANRRAQEAKEESDLSKRELAAKIRRLEAQAERDMSSSSKTRMEARLEAMEAALEAIANPAAATVSENLLDLSNDADNGVTRQKQQIAKARQLQAQAQQILAEEQQIKRQQQEDEQQTIEPASTPDPGNEPGTTNQDQEV